MPDDIFDYDDISDDSGDVEKWCGNDNLPFANTTLAP